MPLVAHNDLPTFDRLRRQGQTILSPERAAHQDIRELHIGVLNMMPDAALQATERQFFRLVGESNPIAQIYLHLFTVAGQQRGEQARDHIARYYEPIERIKSEGLDALIITGANPAEPELRDETFWDGLTDVMTWAEEKVTSTLCSCLATHAVLEHKHGMRRRLQPEKRWGVFQHRTVDREHPLVSGVNTRFDVPHSRWNDVGRDQFETAGLRILVESPEVGVHMATSRDGFRTVFLQGHPEYDTVSLLKEYKREVLRVWTGVRTQFPPFPEHFFGPFARSVLGEFEQRLTQARKSGEAMPEFPDSLIIQTLDNTWHDTGHAIIANWIGLIYQLTHVDRGKPFMDEVDPDDPLGLHRKHNEAPASRR